MSEVLDPTKHTSLSFNRKAFVGISAGAAAVAGTIAQALAQATDFGKPHPPIVPENDPAITVERVTITRPDVAMDAYAAYPKRITATTPGVVVIQHIWGVDATIRDTVRRYAKEGFIAIAPDLFVRSHPPSGDGVTDIAVFRPAASAMKDDVTHGDALAAHDWIRAKAPRGKIGITGFCMGGTIVLKQVIGNTDYAAASMFYGSVRPFTPAADPTTPESFAYTSKITTPLMGSFGARDTSIKPDDVRAMYATLKAPHDAKVYDEAGHGFFDDTRSSYSASAASDAWSRTLGWFHTYLS
jgi:carboxymethylenebutenolidase